MSEDRWVLLRRVEEYDPVRMSEVVREGFELLGRKPKGKVLIKPNVVFANRNYSQHAFTRPELVGAVADRVREIPWVTDLTVGESAASPSPRGSTSRNPATTRWAAGTGSPSWTSTRTATRR